MKACIHMQILQEMNICVRSYMHSFIRRFMLDVYDIDACQIFDFASKSEL